ncbi:MAG: glutaredoxin 3 [Gammaproteobacteria bacterium]|nr:glutaredoxin 3 [Gammaproteobacteria bacterium]
MPRVTVYSSGLCPYCFWAKGLLANKNVSFEEIRVDRVAGAHDEMLSKSNGQMTVPQIFIDDFHIGGFDDLQAMDEAGKLDPMLAG